MAKGAIYGLLPATSALLIPDNKDLMGQGLGALLGRRSFRYIASYNQLEGRNGYTPGPLLSGVPRWGVSLRRVYYNHSAQCKAVLLCWPTPPRDARPVAGSR